MRYAAIFCLIFLQACTEKTGTDSVITVGSTSIALKEAKRDFQELSAGLPVQKTDQGVAEKELLNQLIDRYLILEYGKEHSISISDTAFNAALEAIRSDFTDEGFKEALLRDYIDLDQWKAQLRKRLLEKKILAKVTRQVPPPNHAAILHYYKTHASSFYTERQVRFRQIVTRTAKEAKDLLKRLKKGEDFSTLARKNSIAPEAAQGGVVGWVSKGQLEKTMDTALFSLKPGRLSPIVHSPYGYHLFQILESRPAGVRPLPEVSREIESDLSRRRIHVFLAGWLKKLRGQIKVHLTPNLLELLEQ